MVSVKYTLPLRTDGMQPFHTHPKPCSTFTQIRYETNMNFINPLPV